jgi:SNF2 family DNA or RNA helicase
MKEKASEIGDLSYIKSTSIYEYTRVDSSAFRILRIDGYEEGGEALANSISLSVFDPLKSAEVEGCNCEELAQSSGDGKPLLEVGGDDSGVECIECGRLDAFHLAVPSLYPKSTFDFHRLLDFPKCRSLFPFQRDGVAFLIEHESGLLADEMGLGKSVQAIVAARLLFEANAVKSCLVLCPKSVLADWENRFEEWAPDLRVSKICGSASSRRKLWSGRTHVYLVTYDTLREDIFTSEDTAVPLSFDLVILDEVQRMRNSPTKTFQAVSKINGTIRWGLSGTPLENRVEELTTIFSYLKPGLFKKVEVDDPLLVRSTVKPFVLRRTKSNVLSDLPEKAHNKVLLDLEPNQRAAYELAEREGVIALKEKGQMATITHVMALISKLKQICNIEPVSGESCKLEYLQDMLRNLSETEDKMLVFSQYPKKTLEIIEPKLRHYSPLIYHGSLTNRQRAQVLKQFEEDENVKVLLMSLKAGGLGLTLTVANYVAHFDSWWNPAVMSQAEDRTHRIGQKKNVFVTSLITRNTVEGRIQKILEEKRDLFREVVGEISDGGLTGLLTEKELFGLFGLRRDDREKSSSLSG